MQEETYNWIRRVLPLEKQDAAISRIEKRDAIQSNIIKGIKENGTYTEFVAGSANIHEFLKAISANNNRFAKGESKYKIIVLPQFELKHVNGKMSHCGFNMTCAPSL